MNQEQYDIFGLMSPEEAEEFKPKPKPLVGTTLSEVRHAKEKKGLQGEYKEGWEEATDNEKTSIPVKAAQSNTYQPNPKVAEDKTPEFLSYKKYFCYAGHQILIEDPTLSFEGIRKRMVKTFPELSKDRVMWTYTPPTIPKAKKKKENGKTDDLPAFGFEESRAGNSGELENISNNENISTDIEPDTEAAEENNEREDTATAVDSSVKSEAKTELLPSIADGVELFGMVVPILKGAKKGAIREKELQRLFLNWGDLLARPTVRNLLVGYDGLYEVRITPVGIFKVRLTQEESFGTEEVSEGVELKVPLIPQDLFLAIRDFFVRLALRDTPLEAIAQIYYDGQKYFAHVPHQNVSKTGADNTTVQVLGGHNILVMEIHSHNVMIGEFSEKDDLDELATGIYVVWGNLDRVTERKATLSCRFSCGGHYRPINIMDIVKGGLSVPRYLPDEEELERWLSRIHVEGGDSVA